MGKRQNRDVEQDDLRQRLHKAGLGFCPEGPGEISRWWSGAEPPETL
jgi:hypothetical protein